MGKLDGKIQGNEEIKSDEKSPEARFGEATLKDYNARFEGSDPEIKIRDIDDYTHNSINTANSLPGV